MRRLAGALACLLLSALARAGAQDPGRVKYEQYTLPNGLTVVLSEEHSAQVVAVTMYYDVGSRNERAGRTGFAHLFEHVMFQGSANVKKMEHIQLVQRAGGQVNGTTNEDRTYYYEVLPSNRLNLGLWLEADRMRSLNVTDSTFENQRQAVKEERRLKVDNQPYSRAFFEDEYGTADTATCFPYAHSIIGSMADLDAARTPDVQEFFRQYYAPNNAVLTVVGDFDTAEAKRMVEQYFGSIPRGPARPAEQPCQARFNAGARRRDLVDPKATLPATFRVYAVPAYEHPDTPALSLLATILGQGESSRLNRVLARETRAAVGTQTYLNPFGPRRGPGVFLAFAIANQGVAVDSVDRLLAAQVARLGAEGVDAAELEKAKNSFRAGVINQRQQALNLADALQTARMFLGTPDAINTDLDRYMKVTLDDIRRVARTYLVPDNSLTLLYKTPGGATP
jgi:zinc protease